MGWKECLRSAGRRAVARLSRGAAMAAPGRSSGRVRSAGTSWRRHPAGAALAAIGVLFAGAAVAAGCGASPQQLSLTSKDNGGTIGASKGDTIVLQLDENPTTGYHWVMHFSSGLKVTSSEYKQRSASTNLVGAGGTHTWIIDVTGSGTQAIGGSYEPPGTQTVVPLHFKATVKVN
jgi:predicted secreted protein